MESQEARQPDAIRVSRDQLYDMVWREPMIKVAMRYEVSSSFLARVCARLNIPRPERGYWAKLSAGHQVPRPSLPESRPGDELEWVRGGQAPKVERARPKSDVEPPPRHAIRKSRQRSHHPLVVAASPHFLSAKELESEFFRPSKRCMADILTSRRSLERTLLAASDLYNLFEANGHRVQLATWHSQMFRHSVNQCEEGTRKDSLVQPWSPDRPTITRVGDLAIGISVFETTEKALMRYIDGKYIRETDVTKARAAKYPNSWSTWTTTMDKPSGRICVKAYLPYQVVEWSRQWLEGKSGNLSEMLQAVVAEIEAEASSLLRLLEDAERKAEEQRLLWEAQWEATQRRLAEEAYARRVQESRAALISIIESWATERNIHNFFPEIESLIPSLDEGQRDAIVAKLKDARGVIGERTAVQQLLDWKAPKRA